MTAPLPPRSALPGLALLLAANVQAQAIDPGLWEVQHDMQMPGQPPMAPQMQQMQEQMRNLPPEARRMMEQQMGAGRGPGGALRICITPEEARGVIREGQKEGDCTYSQVSHSGNVWKGRMVCANPPSQGEFTTTLYSSSHYSTTALLTGQQNQRMHLKTEARRVGDDCGNLARPAPGKKP